ncbi:hypothetical protein ACFZC5_08860 [Nocardia gamkensis]
MPAKGIVTPDNAADFARRMDFGAVMLCMRYASDAILDNGPVVPQVDR